ncbi:putative protein kinase RLK-Pelle-DLSV family [Helianthus annuus]|nr:putative protein kinase RLK-Pelle-DLSV family [Helianthus annuus]
MFTRYSYKECCFLHKVGTCNVNLTILSFDILNQGMLENGQEIAVKRLKTVSTQCGNEFKNEAEPPPKLNHCNLVQLCGYTIEGIGHLLIYELLTHGSLDKYIFGKFSWVTELTLIIIVVNLIVKRNLITFLLF